MDLYATAQKDRLASMMEGIEIPRLRGLRYMAEETTATEEEIAKSCKYCYRETYRLHYKYGHFISHGYRSHYDNRVPRRDARRSAKRTRIQLEAFNRYVGRKDVMMVHARIGGYNWKEYGGFWLEKEPWFIERVDDGFDPTYCDIYVKVKEVKE